MIPIDFSTWYIIITLMWSKNYIERDRILQTWGWQGIQPGSTFTVQSREKSKHEQIYISYKKLKVKRNMWDSIWLKPTTVIRT